MDDFTSDLIDLTCVQSILAIILLVPEEFMEIQIQRTCMSFILPGMQKTDFANSEPSILNKYQSKPYLFSGDLKDKGTLHFGSGKSKGILEQFEEDKKKAREKHESEVLSSLFFHIQENIQELRAAFSKFEEQSSSREKSTLDQYEHISKAMENNSERYASILKTLNEKIATEQDLLETERQLLSKYTEIADLKSSFQLLKEHVEDLKTEQCQQHLKLTDQLKLMPDHLQYANILSELQKLKPVPRSPIRLVDNISQTSPILIQDLCLVSEKKTFLTTTKVCQRGSLQTEPYMTLSPSKHGQRAKSGAPTPVLYSSGRQTTTVIQFDPSNTHLNSKGNINENSSLESAKSHNQRHYNYNHNGQIHHDVSERMCMHSQENAQSSTENIVSRRKKQKKAVSTVQKHQTSELHARPSRVRKHQTVNTDTKSVISNTSMESKPKNVKSKKACKKKVIIRKSKTGCSGRKRKLVNSSYTPDKCQRQLTCEPSTICEDLSGRDFKKNVCTAKSNVSNRSSFTAKQETLHKSQVKQDKANSVRRPRKLAEVPKSKANSVRRPRKLAELPKSKAIEISETTRGSTPGKEKQPFQWDNSSQDSSYFYWNVTSGNQMNWFSPSSPLVYNPLTAVSKKDGKSAFESIFFDSSDDSG